VPALIYRKAALPKLRYARLGSTRAMTKEDCRANALRCYRIAQKASDGDVRRTLLDLAVQWRELAAQIERLQWQNAAEPTSPGGRPTRH
jgi:hypothetical protein